LDRGDERLQSPGILRRQTNLGSVRSHAQQDVGRELAQSRTEGRKIVWVIHDIEWLSGPLQRVLE